MLVTRLAEEEQRWAVPIKSTSHFLHSLLTHCSPVGYQITSGLIQYGVPYGGLPLTIAARQTKLSIHKSVEMLDIHALNSPLGLPAVLTPPCGWP